MSMRLLTTTLLVMLLQPVGSFYDEATTFSPDTVGLDDFPQPNLDGAAPIQHWVLKSRSHFCSGFDETGHAKTVMIVDAPGPYLGTVHLDRLPYRNVDIKQLFPYDRRSVSKDSP